MKAVTYAGAKRRHEDASQHLTVSVTTRKYINNDIDKYLNGDSSDEYITNSNHPCGCIK